MHPWVYNHLVNNLWPISFLVIILLMQTLHSKLHKTNFMVILFFDNNKLWESATFHRLRAKIEIYKVSAGRTNLPLKVLLLKLANLSNLDQINC